VGSKEPGIVQPVYDNESVGHFYELAVHFDEAAGGFDEVAAYFDEVAGGFYAAVGIFTRQQEVLMR